MNMRSTLLSILADGNFHSGDEMGAQLGVSRTAVWKCLRSLKGLGLELHAVRGRGYRLSRSIELLSQQQIESSLSARAAAHLSELVIAEQLVSTNHSVMELARNGAPSGYACFAEHQTAGRGRRGRTWQAAFASSICMSLLWRFRLGAESLVNLGLVVGVAMARAVRLLGAEDVKLKWPNDVYWQDRKLGGVLLEMHGEARGPCAIVVGVGLNVAMPESAARKIDQPWVDLHEVLGCAVSRNDVAVAVLQELLLALACFQKGGAAEFLDEWRAADCLLDRQVVLHVDETEVVGVARGIDVSGALLLERNGCVAPYSSGDVSLRLLPLA